MKLPKLAYPIYEVKLLSSEEPVKFRPFTVREEQLMLMAVESPDLESTVNCLKQIINNCVLDDKFDVDNMAMVDLETMFLHLRARSIGEVGKATYKCLNVAGESKECGMILQVPINFLQVPVINVDKPKKIMFDDKVGVVMRYPPVSLLRKLVNTQPELLEYMVAANCLDVIFDADAVYYAKDCTQQELMEFIMNLPGDKYEFVKQFINEAPKTTLVHETKCPKCDFEHKFTLEGIEDFFV